MGKRGADCYALIPYAGLGGKNAAAAGPEVTLGDPERGTLPPETGGAQG